MRFPEFEGEWETKKLGEIADKIGDGLHGTPTYLSDSEFYFINGNNLVNGKIELNENTKNIDIETYERNRKGLKENTLLISLNGTIGNIARYNNENVMLGKSVGYFNFDKASDFIYFSLQTKATQNYFKSELTGSTIKNLSLKTLRETPITLPYQNEQNKIVSFLSLIDGRILTQNKIIEELSVLKTNIAKKIFSQKTRFQDNGNVFSPWKKYKLKNIANRIVEKNSENNQNVLTISAQHGLISQLEFFNKSVAAKNILGYYLLKKNDFAYNKSYSNGYPMGAIKRLNQYEKGVVSTLYICFEFNHLVNKDFMEHYFESGIQNSEIEKVAQEGARNHGLLNIGVSDFFNITINLPSIDEQKAIASLLSSLVSKIENEKQILNQLNLQKQFLLKELFI
ncbi:restriction endonuclease subunit S [Myroides odoratus]|uniref:restriction endonuclease subunit S n=1 Tax=Myroides odoratus TaxID=256 RepID=UPI0007660C07|nr:restriction endonuclease subunit S [Myroides odoratus]